MNKLFFIIGMRRSGTSILRTLLMKHPDIKDIEFEPHPLWNAVDLSHFERFKNLSHVQSRIAKFKRAGAGERWHGAKFALNPGVKAMEWVWLDKIFNPKFIFIVRKKIDTFKSYEKQDRNSIRGYLPQEIYFPLWKFHVHDFLKYHTGNPSKSTIIYYEDLVKDADKELEKVWKLLKLEPLKGMNQYMKRPEFWSDHEMC